MHRNEVEFVLGRAVRQQEGAGRALAAIPKSITQTSPLRAAAILILHLVK